MIRYDTMSSLLVYEGPIVAKPRMVRSDKWKIRAVTTRYWAFKNLINIAAKNQGFALGECFTILFEIEMPKSWSQKKKDEMDGQPHKSRPDLDNMEKSICDCLLAEDSGVWKVMAEKRWAAKSRIVIQNIDYERSVSHT